MEAPAVDCRAADHDVLSDVLSFLDSHDDDHTDDGMASSSRTSDSDSATCIATTMTMTASRPGAHAKAKSKKRPPRPDRYWAKKHELNKLRSEVEHLNSKLKLLRLCARSPGEIKVTSAMSVTIRKTCNRKLASWKRLVNHEREMREQAEQTNAKLHALLQYQHQWADGMSGEVAQAVEALRQVPSLESKQRAVVVEKETSKRTRKSKIHNAVWCEVLRQLYLEAYAFVTGGIVYQIESFDWVAASESARRSRPLLEWTTSFGIPRKDPRSAGRLWWEPFQQISGSHGSCETIDGEIPRMERTCKWSLWDDTNKREVKSTSVSVIENRPRDDIWIMAWTTTVYDTSDVVLFRATASVAITRGSAANAESCLTRAHYRIHHPSAALVSKSRRHEGTRRPVTEDRISSDAKVAMNNWVKLIRDKDRERQRAFMRAQ